jgi:hypothetical protein
VGDIDGKVEVGGGAPGVPEFFIDEVDWARSSA